MAGITGRLRLLGLSAGRATTLSRRPGRNQRCRTSRAAMSSRAHRPARTGRKLTPLKKSTTSAAEAPSGPRMSIPNSQDMRRHSEVMVASVCPHLVEAFLRCKQPLFGREAQTPSPYLECRSRLNVAVPIRFTLPGGYHDHLARRPVETHHFDDGPVDPPRLSPAMGDLQEAISKQPASRCAYTTRTASTAAERRRLRAVAWPRLHV